MRTRIATGCIAWLIAAGTALAVLVPTVSAGATSTGMSSASSSGAWSRLWWNRDQQGERLLEAGDAADAAVRFRDPQRRAYADLQAGRYAEAAQLLAPFKDALSQYNRGNALAHAGQLQAALTAYDAALARAPNDRDARHNRDLVARALAQHQPQHQPRQSQQQSQHQPQRSRQQSQQSQRQSQPQHGSRGSAPHTPKGGDQQGHDGSAPKGASSSSDANRAGAGRAAPNQTPAGKAGAGQAEPSAAGSQAAAGQKAGAGTRAAAGNPTGRGGAATPKPPPSEQALSLDQWLRRLPDDPGGLLRRKFLIEHLMRQQNQQQGTP